MTHRVSRIFGFFMGIVTVFVVATIIGGWTYVPLHPDKDGLFYNGIAVGMVTVMMVVSLCSLVLAVFLPHEGD